MLMMKIARRHQKTMIQHMLVLQSLHHSCTSLPRRRRRKEKGRRSRQIQTLRGKSLRDR